MSIVNFTQPRTLTKKDNGNDMRETVVVHEVNDQIDREGMVKKDNYRIHLILPEKAMNAIHVIQERMEASTTSEAIRRSLLLTRSITDAIANGGRVVIEKEDGTKEVVLVS